MIDINSEQLANRVKWVKALLSGDYTQGYGKLRTWHASYSSESAVSTWCCLGVAGNVLDPGAQFISEDSLAGFLPEDWATEKLGITTEQNAHEDYDGDQVCATSWNDGRNLSFRRIADRIALATERSVPFGALGYDPDELVGKEHGEYASEWLARIEDITNS